MEQLKIETFRKNIATTTMKITGFSEKELTELNSMDYREMKETIVDTLDRRNHGAGSMYHNGYGMYQAWIRDGAVYIEVGNSCD